MDIEEKKIKFINILNEVGAKKMLNQLSFPIYFLDFEAITNNKEWMFKNNLALDQQISSFSFLKIDKWNDDETKIKHFNFINKKEDYKLMTKKLTDFYQDKNGSVVVWGQELEVKSISKLMKSSDEKYHKKLASMLANLIDLRQLFHTGSFLKIEPYGKSALNYVAQTLDVYKESSIKDGKEAHFILEHTITKKNIDKKHLNSIIKRITDYNNSDVINIKRILIEVCKILKISK